MLTSFVLPSEKPNADVDRTFYSLSHIEVEQQIVSVSCWREINKYKKDEWFSVFWDNEYIDDGLQKALPVFLSFPNIETLILYKKDKLVTIEATWRYRVFRNYVYLVNDCKPVSVWLNREAILDGWVREHDSG